MTKLPRSRRGFTLIEVVIGLGLLAALTLAVVTGINAANDFQIRVNDRIRVAGLQQRILWLLSSGDYVRDVLMKEPANEELRRCLEEGDCPDEGTFTIPNLDREPRMPPLKLTFHKLDRNLVEARGRFVSADAWFSSILISVYFPRQHFLKGPGKPPQVSCPPGKYLTGIEVKSWRPICAWPKPEL